MKKIMIIIVCVSLGFFSFAEKDNEIEMVHQDKNIVEVAIENGNFSILVAALKATDLAGVLSGENQFTVFAPSNAAFDKLPSGTVASILKPDNKDALTDLLMYHVIAGKYTAADIIKAIKDNKGKFLITTVKGEKITLMMSGNNVVVKDAKGGVSVITMTDVDASNGMIHAIDSVLMPKE